MKEAITEIEDLKNDYHRKVTQLTRMIKIDEKDAHTLIRLKAKRGCYEQIASELNELIIRLRNHE